MTITTPAGTLVRTRTAAVALGAGAVLALTACGGDASASGPGTDAGSGTAAATGTAAAATAAAAAQPATNFDGFEDAVVTTDWLEENLDNPDVAVVEVSVEPGVYERSHIPGAVNLSWHTDLVDTVNRDIIDQEAFQDIARKAGINDDTTVVLYGDRNNWFSAWGAWIFEIYGAQDIRLLDGGRVAWEAENRPVEPGAPTPQPGDFTASEPDTALRALLPDVLEIATGEADKPLVDIRSADEYNGVIFAPEGFQELAVRAGHIPGAVNVPWGAAVAEDGRFRSIEELRALYADVGVDGTKPVVVYCRIGERASHTWFVLHRLLGYDVALYDGSWTEYGNAVGVPIENPAGTVFGGA